jgi:hypothetical protein
MKLAWINLLTPCCEVAAKINFDCYSENCHVLQSSLTKVNILGLLPLVAQQSIKQTGTKTPTELQAGGKLETEWRSNSTVGHHVVTRYIEPRDMFC